MTEHDNSGKLSPRDERAAEKFFAVFGDPPEAPIAVGKRLPPLDFAIRDRNVTELALIKKSKLPQG